MIILILVLLSLLTSNAVFIRRDKTILYLIITTTILICCFCLCLNTFYLDLDDKGLGIYTGFYITNIITHNFQMFISVIVGFILILTGFYLMNLKKKIPFKTELLGFIVLGIYLYFSYKLPCIIFDSAFNTKFISFFITIYNTVILYNIKKEMQYETSLVNLYLALFLVCSIYLSVIYLHFNPIIAICYEILYSFVPAFSIIKIDWEVLPINIKLWNDKIKQLFNELLNVYFTNKDFSESTFNWEGISNEDSKSIFKEIFNFFINLSPKYDVMEGGSSETAGKPEAIPLVNKMENPFGSGGNGSGANDSGGNNVQSSSGIQQGGDNTPLVDYEGEDLYGSGGTNSERSSPERQEENTSSQYRPTVPGPGRTFYESTGPEMAEAFASISTARRETISIPEKPEDHSIRGQKRPASPENKGPNKFLKMFWPETPKRENLDVPTSSVFQSFVRPREEFWPNWTRIHLPDGLHRIDGTRAEIRVESGVLASVYIPTTIVKPDASLEWRDQKSINNDLRAVFFILYHKCGVTWVHHSMLGNPLRDYIYYIQANTDWKTNDEGAFPINQRVIDQIAQVEWKDS